MFLVDSHCHLDALDQQKLGCDLKGILAKAKARGVGHLLSIATTLEGFCQLRQQVAPFSEVSLSCGVHPLELNGELNCEQLYQLATDQRVVALGETGLDYYYQKENKSVQQRAFVQHIEVAKRLNKPIIVHTRSARADTLAILQHEQANTCGGVLHCFTEDQSMAEALLDLGFYISLSGIVTFRTAQALRELVSFIPLDRLLIETDSPYLAPVPYRGKQNQPAYVREVAECVAALKGISLATLAHATTENFCRLFQIIVQPAD